MQLMENYCPYAAGLLCFLVPMFEPLGIETPLVKDQKVTLMDFPYTPTIVGSDCPDSCPGALSQPVHLPRHWSNFQPHLQCGEHLCLTMLHCDSQ